MQSHSLIIDGNKVPTKQCFEVLNPANEKTCGLAPIAELSDLDRSIDCANRSFKKWRRETEFNRQKACRQIADHIESHAEELAKLLTLEQGKPLNGFGSRWEIGGAVAWTRYTASLSLPMKQLQNNEEGTVELHRKPIGVVGSILPWNFPVLIAIWHIIPAILAGNTVVCKPSPYTPLTTLRVVELMNQILPKGVVNCVTGDDNLGEHMSSHNDIDKIVFTGSCPTGKKIFSSAAEGMKRMTLELGGNDAGIVLPDVKPAAIAEGLFWGAFINGGQTCAALKRLYVHDDVYNEVCDALVKFARSIPMGDGLDEKSMLGPVQNSRQYEKVVSLIDSSADQGRVLLGGRLDSDALSQPGYFHPLTIIADLQNGDDLVDEEQFGPALPIVAYSDVDEAIDFANDNANGLGGSVWSRDITKAKQVASEMECGSVWINSHGMIQPNAPFGGVKQSGIGVEFGEEGLAENTTIQVVFS